jgi:hypothetical protein
MTPCWLLSLDLPRGLARADRLQGIDNGCLLTHFGRLCTFRPTVYCVQYTSLTFASSAILSADSAVIASWPVVFVFTDDILALWHKTCQTGDSFWIVFPGPGSAPTTLRPVGSYPWITGSA